MSEETDLVELARERGLSPEEAKSRLETMQWALGFIENYREKRRKEAMRLKSWVD